MLFMSWLAGWVVVADDDKGGLLVLLGKDLFDEDVEEVDVVVLDDDEEETLLFLAVFTLLLLLLLLFIIKSLNLALVEEEVGFCWVLTSFDSIDLLLLLMWDGDTEEAEDWLLLFARFSWDCCVKLMKSDG